MFGRTRINVALFDLISMNQDQLYNASLHQSEIVIFVMAD